jgi:Holliday junction resolvase-like predicted endonuclease
MKLEDIEEMIREGRNVEEILSAVNWKEFEEKVEEIFQRHNFRTMKNFRIKTSKRFEIDIIAEKGNLLFVVDCKQWRKGRYKLSALRKAAEKQIERAEAIKQSLIGLNKRVIPLLLTLYDEGIYSLQGVFIVPLFKLNSFLLEF